MTSFLLMVSSIKAARIFVFETAEILASTIYLCINTENLNQSIEWSIPQFIYLSRKVTVSTKIKIEKKLVRLNVIHVSVAKHGCFFFYHLIEPEQEPITWSVQLPYWTYVTAFSQNGLILNYLFAENRLLELTWVIRSMKREEKKWRPYVGTSSCQNYANSTFLLLYSSIPILSFHILLYPLQIFHTCEKNSQERGSSLYFYLYLYFFFSCSSDSGPSKEDFMKRVQIPDDEEAKCQRWWRARKQEIAWAKLCASCLHLKNLHPHSP